MVRSWRRVRIVRKSDTDRLGIGLGGGAVRRSMGLRHPHDLVGGPGNSNRASVHLVCVARCRHARHLCYRPFLARRGSRTQLGALRHQRGRQKGHGFRSEAGISSRSLDVGNNRSWPGASGLARRGGRVAFVGACVLRKREIGIGDAPGRQRSRDYLDEPRPNVVGKAHFAPLG